MLNKGILQRLVEEDFGYKHQGTSWGRSQLHSSFVVDEAQQKWYWNSENKGGDVLQYLILIRGMKRDDAKSYLAVMDRTTTSYAVQEDNTDSLPYERLVDTFWNFGKDKREYWYKRHLTDSTIDRLRLGFFNGWNVLPIYKNGRFVNFQCRRDVPTKSIRYWYSGSSIEPELINSDILSLVNTIYITEGTVDSILLTQEGLPSISHTGGSGFWNNGWYNLFSKVSEIFYIADNDRAGNFAAKRVANSLGVGRVKIFRFSDEGKKFDTVDFFSAGGTINQLKELLDSSSKHLFEIGELNEQHNKHRHR
jgi:DNA primase